MKLQNIQLLDLPKSLCVNPTEYLHVPSVKHQLHCHGVVHVDTTEPPKPQNIAKIKPRKKKERQKKQTRKAVFLKKSRDS
jgi:hypothetical protein